MRTHAELIEAAAAAINAARMIEDLSSGGGASVTVTRARTMFIVEISDTWTAGVMRPFRGFSLVEALAKAEQARDRWRASPASTDGGGGG